MADEFLKVARISDIPEGKSRKIIIGDEEIALWNVEGRIYAICNVCPHQHFPVLHEASLKGMKVTCPMHGWTYSLETGIADSGSGRVKTYRVKIVGEDVLVEKPVHAW